MSIFRATVNICFRVYFTLSQHLSAPRLGWCGVPRRSSHLAAAIVPHPLDDSTAPAATTTSAPPSPALPPCRLRVLSHTPHHADVDMNRSSTTTTTVSTAATTIMTTYHGHPSEQLQQCGCRAGELPEQNVVRAEGLDAMFAEISGQPESPTGSADVWVGRLL
jgi:hypothetical protein